MTEKDTVTVRVFADLKRAASPEAVTVIDRGSCLINQVLCDELSKPLAAATGSTCRRRTPVVEPV